MKNNVYFVFYLFLKIMYLYKGSSRNLPPQANAIKSMPHHTPLSLEALRAHTAMHGKIKN